MIYPVANSGFAEREQICSKHSPANNDITNDNKDAIQFILDCVFEKEALCWPDLDEKKCKSEPAILWGSPGEYWAPDIISLARRRPYQDPVPNDSETNLPTDYFETNQSPECEDVGNSSLLDNDTFTNLCRQIGCDVDTNNTCVAKPGLYNFSNNLGNIRFESREPNSNQTYLYELLNVCRKNALYLVDVDGSPLCSDLSSFSTSEYPKECSDFGYRDAEFCRVMGAGIGLKCQWQAAGQCVPADCEDYDYNPRHIDGGPNAYGYILDDCRYIGCLNQKDGCCLGIYIDNDPIAALTPSGFGCNLNARSDTKYLKSKLNSFRGWSTIEEDDSLSEVKLFVDNCTGAQKGFLHSVTNQEGLACRELPNNNTTCLDFSLSKQHCFFMSRYSKKKDMQCVYDEEYQLCVELETFQKLRIKPYVNNPSISNPYKESAQDSMKLTLILLQLAVYILCITFIFAFSLSLTKFIKSKWRLRKTRKTSGESDDIDDLFDIDFGITAAPPT